ncbi:hypothetical protein KI809_00525 [Geobacter pelophilus]|uniref:Uncharacterized protein n=1 Tax=Geoanaerobacter pelophilus TaxID=60036 RepID=A0AAW4KZ07_9BACT|nr:hypothetical protein [Geoanaerobacter pelophilus]MBT0662775.1 hypothetical protein [Geoanaerobacter pelophilus]
MKTKKIARTLIPSAALLCLTLAQPAHAYQSPEAQSFISGFNSFKNKDYQSAIKQFSTLLGQPESQLRELSLVFLARAYFKEGNTSESAYLLYLWKQEFPDSNLKTTLEQDLMRETAKIDINAILARKEQERIAREKAEAERIAREKAEQERLAAIKAEEERKAREKAEAERIAREKAEQERLAAIKAEEERKAREKAEAERIAREKAEQEKLAAIKAEEERKAREKAEAERIAREKAAAERLANHKASIFAAVSAPKLVMAVSSGDLVAVAGKEMVIPLTITNPGIMADSFTLATAFPEGWQSRFEIEGKPITTTAEIAPGASTTVQLKAKPPVSVLEGQQLALPIRLTSQVAGDRPISTEIAMTASAPIVRAVVKKVDSVDGDNSRAQCLVSVLNVGSAEASSLNITINHPASYVPVTDGSATFSKVSGETIRISQLNLASGGLQEFLINFKVKGGTSKGISCKAELTLE